MKLLEITLRNYRNFSNYHVSLGQKTTVFIGRNGMGKTNLIEGMVQCLSFIFSKQRDTQQYEFIRSTDQGVKYFKATDPRYENRNYIYPLALDAEGSIVSEDKTIQLKWSFEQESKKSGLKDSKYREAYQSFWNHYNTLEEKPILAFFSDGFPHKDTNISMGMKEKLKSGNPLPACDGYYQWDKEQSCVNIWKRYFVQQWMNNRLSPDPEKEAYVNAINEKIKEFTRPINSNDNSNVIKELSVDFRDGEASLLITLEDGSTKPFESLPAGYERIYSMVLDLASRSFLLNRSVNPEGIVLIDEIELHLHPSLAAEILIHLQCSFPRIQFIVSTHSPMVISNFDQSKGEKDDYRLINLLKNEDEFYNRPIDNAYGLDYNSSVVNVMGTKQQQKFNDNLVDVYRYWEQRDELKAKRIADLLLQKYDHNSDIIKELGL